MAGNEPSPTTLGPGDERKVQLFLERAAPIVLEHPILNIRHWQSLMALAEELELSEEQVRTTVEDLRRRGVVTDIDLSPPKPPPLPPSEARTPQSTPPSSTPRKPPVDPDEQDTKPDEDFSLMPPPPGSRAVSNIPVAKPVAPTPPAPPTSRLPPPPSAPPASPSSVSPPAARAVPSEDGIPIAKPVKRAVSDPPVAPVVAGPPTPPPPPEAPAVRGTATPTAATPPNATQPSATPPSAVPPTPPAANGPARSNASTPPSAPPPPETRSSPRVERFIERASSIVASQRGFGPKTQALLAAAADELGLSDEEATAALDRIHGGGGASPTQSASTPPSSQPPAPPPGSDPPSSDAKRWRVEGKPSPDPTPPPAKPSVTYEQYLSQSLSNVGSETIPEEVVTNVLRHGTKVLGLAPIYARHLLDDAAEAGELTLTGYTKPAEPDKPEEPSDPRTRKFLERAAPILSEHHGINVKSRVLLNAVAKEVGLDEDEMEQAIASLQGDTPPDVVAARQEERLTGYRELVRGSLQSLPRKMLTPDIDRELTEHGIELHGVEPDRVAQAIRAVCSELGLMYISEDESREHISSLVRQRLQHTRRLRLEVRERLYAEGAQWGLTSDQVDEVIDGETRVQDRERKSEESFTTGALWTAGIAGGLVVCFFLYVIVSRSLRTDDVAAAGAAAVEAELAELMPEATVELDNSWFGAELALTMQEARNVIPDQFTSLRNVGAIDAARRGQAYKSLAAATRSSTRSAEHRQLLMKILSHAYGREPEDANATTLVESLLNEFPSPDEELSLDKRVYPRVFVGVRTVAAVLEQTDLDTPRAAALVEAVERKTGYVIDLGVGATSAGRDLHGAVAARLYERLIDVAGDQPSAAKELRQAILGGESHVDRDKLVKLDADFLLTLLTTDPNAWLDHEELLVSTIGSRDTNAVLRMIELYERTENRELRDFMVARLLRRVGVSDEPRSVAETAMAARQALGISSDSLTGGRLASFIRNADRVLEATKAEADQPSRVLREIVVLAHHATLGAALAHAEPGFATFDALAKEDPLKSLAPPKKEEPDDDDEGDEEADDDDDEDRGTRRAAPFNPVKNKLRLLVAENRPATHVRALRDLADVVDRVGDLDLSQARQLATFLCAKKPAEVHEAAVAASRDLARWSNLKLAMADEVADALLDREREYLPREKLEELVSRMLGSGIRLEANTIAVESMQAAFLRSVLAGMDDVEIESHGEFTQFDRAGRFLADRYRQQGRRLGHAVAEAATPAAVLQQLLPAVAGRINAESLDARSQRYLKSLPYEMRAVEYLASNDLQRTVLLERMWLNVLVIATVQDDPRRRSEAERIQLELVASDQSSANVLLQMREGQEAFVKLWILRNRPL